ncbi:hypothetical protein CPJCM30710_24880 [Clostridium polyendosporum]|uniref:Uncharacterized protein n=1 Tax=Clostridium polyendosporum TaxID=69208 RepID=A0A919VH32_9CLOT|nr:hypothetical protein [Clostridium polyendosporum]GIM29822.1 hypothetical protein CPJCM30710_24880 [Clostridium polyendosporum]
MLDKERLRQAVIKGVSQMPSEAVVYRDVLNQYNEPEDEPILITTITGLLYEKERVINLNLQDKGETLGKSSTRFLVDYNEESLKVKTSDILSIGDKKYRVVYLGENFEVYFDMVVQLDG